MCAEEIPTPANGYAGKLLRVDLTRGEMREQRLEEETLKKWIGGHCLGAKILYEEVPPGVEWPDPENRLIMATGPLAGTKVPGSGTFCVVTKGPMTNGAASSQANGFFGAYLKFSGFDGIVIEGVSKNLVYLYVHDGTAELKDATHLAGKYTLETEEQIKKELGKGKHQASVYSIGPAGENLVRFACIIGDEGHALGHNGVGAVMGSKKLKAVVACRQGNGIAVADGEKLAALCKELRHVTKEELPTKNLYTWGPSYLYVPALKMGSLPVKNYTTNIFPEAQDFQGESVRARSDVELKPSPCWACHFHHCHTLKITEGPYAGYTGKEMEYEQGSAFGPLIGVTDVAAAMVLSNESDRLGIDTNEAGWVIAWVMECFEKGILTEQDTDGLKMNWGNAEAARAMLHNIAHRQGFGNLLAEGTKRAAEHIGGDALHRAIYTKKGSTPRTHDHRARWPEMLDAVTSSTGTVETGPVFQPADFGLNVSVSSFVPEEVAELVAKAKGRRPFEDSLGVCWFTVATKMTFLIDIFNAATGWNFSVQDALDAGVRSANLLKAFDLRHGITPDLDYPSTRYCSTPADGPAEGVDVGAVWERMLAAYYWHMGWDRATGRPLPVTLKSVGLEEIIPDLW